MNFKELRLSCKQAKENCGKVLLTLLIEVIGLFISGGEKTV